MNQPPPSLRSEFPAAIKILIIVRKETASSEQCSPCSNLGCNTPTRTGVNLSSLLPPLHWFRPNAFAHRCVHEARVTGDVGGFILELIHRRPRMFPCQPRISNGITMERWMEGDRSEKRSNWGRCVGARSSLRRFPC